MGEQLVSILIPAFNAERWLGEAISSALAQTWGAKEIIVVDDGSEDGTVDIAKSYRSSGVMVLTQRNRGASAARNRALSVARGDYIQWLDADDVLDATKVAEQMRVSEDGRRSRVLIGGGWGRFYKQSSLAKFQRTALWEDLSPAEWLCRKFEHNLWMALGSWLISRKLTELAGKWNEVLSFDDDGEYIARLIACSSGIKFSKEARYYVRRGNAGLSGNVLTDAKLESFATSIVNQIRLLMAIEDSQQTRTACRVLLARCSVYFYPERMDLFAQLELMAKEIGGSLNRPVLRRKYHWIQAVCGFALAKRAQFALPALRAQAAHRIAEWSEKLGQKVGPLYERPVGRAKRRKNDDVREQDANTVG